MKKVINIVISLAILATGMIGFSRLRYFERSAWVFKTGNEQAFQRNRGSRGGFEEREFRTRPENYRQGDRPDFRNLPDSVRQRIIAERNLRLENDTIKEGRTRTFPGDRGEFRERRFEKDQGRGYDFRRGNSIRLGNVSWFLAVFAGFAVLTIYMDKLFKWKNKKRKNNL